MADSPQKNSDGIVSFKIISEGTPLEDTIQVVSIDVTKAINKIAIAKLVMLDGDEPERDFPISNKNDFKPGNNIEIYVGYNSNETLIFRGIIIRHGISISNQNESRLIIECRDEAIAMTVGRKNINFIKQKDSEIISTITAKYSSLTCDIEATNTTHEELPQHNCTDWDFLLSRAEANGLVVLASDNNISVQAPKTNSAAALTVNYGEDLIEFDADMDARYQYKKVTGVGWDMSTQQVVTQDATKPSLNAQGDIDSDELAKVLNLSEYRLQSSNALEDTSLKDWASAQQIKSGLSRICGTMKFQGNAKARIGGIIEVVGVGNRFSGDLYVSQVNHFVSDGNWVTDISFGMSPSWSAEQRDLAAPGASGLLPPVEGLQVGVVTKLDADPLNQNRIQVTVPVLQTDTPGVWARLATYYASEECGNFFIPEIGDEVVLGYFNNHPGEPVILGSLYSSKRAPANELSAENHIKSLITRSKLKIEFDDENKTLTFLTPGKNTMVFSDKEESILMQDQNGNKIEISPDGITMNSPKDIAIKAGGKITMQATEVINVKSSADVKVEGMNVNLAAESAFTAKGSASSEVSAAGSTTIKGAMVLIN
jgi:Rhs element Vgr protein